VAGSWPVSDSALEGVACDAAYGEGAGAGECEEPGGGEPGSSARGMLLTSRSSESGRRSLTGVCSEDVEASAEALAEGGRG